MNYYLFPINKGEIPQDYYARIRAIAVFNDKTEQNTNGKYVELDGELTGEIALENAERDVAIASMHPVQEENA